MFSRSSEIRAWLQPEELTLLLIQLRRHQAKMAGVNSPSDAFAHLQHQQHSSLLGPSMQVRAPGLPQPAPPVSQYAHMHKHRGESIIDLPST